MKKLFAIFPLLAIAICILMAAMRIKVLPALYAQQGRPSQRIR
jgi:hypothetical protein